MVVGMAEQSDAEVYDMTISKIAVSDGSVTWTMTYSGTESSTS